MIAEAPVSEPLVTRSRALAAPLGQLVALAAVAWALGLEAAAGLPVALAIAVPGWVAHELSPRALKPAVFLAVSAAVLGVHLGWAGALVVLGVGLVLAELPVLPIPRSWRIGLAILGAVELGWLRVHFAEAAWEGPALAVLGSMFMFRLALVLLDPDAAAVPRLERWTYFFQWPNVLFPLYPIVDWHTWTRPPATPLRELHQRGILWVARGFSHLLVYRIVYHQVLPADWEVVDAPSLLWWMFGSFLLYVRISGVFHVVVGLLLLFGRDLPRAQNHYFLASSFSDHYRRVNVYWTAFLEQVVFLPAWFALRRRKLPQAHVLAVLPTFAASWALHHWQSFWIAGRMHVTATDTTFWGALGLLVTLNTAWATARPAAWRGRGAYVLHAAKVVGTFTVITVLWSLWKSATFGLWFARMRLLLDGPALIGLAAVLVGAVAAGTALQALLARPSVEALRGRLPGEGRLAALGCVALAGIALAVAVPLPRATPDWLVDTRDAVSGERLSVADQVVKTRGYYDDLGAAPEATGRITRPPEGWGRLRDSPFARPSPPDVPYEFELVPSASGLFRGVAFSVNRHGMRDRERSVDKPPGTYRIALLGASPEMGEGVGDDEVFSVLVEDVLNRRYGTSERRYEVLNFAVSSRTLDTYVVDYPRRVRPFRPDLVLVADHTADASRILFRLGRAVRLGRPFPGTLGERAAVEAGMRDAEDLDAAAQRLARSLPLVIRELYELLATEVAADGAKVVWLQVPMPLDLASSRSPASAWRGMEAEHLGMVPLRLLGAYGEREREDVAVAPWDQHPNALGHRLLAEALLEQLVAQDAELGIGLTSP